MIDETFGDDDEVDANFYGRTNSSKLLTSVPLGECLVVFHHYHFHYIMIVERGK
jgi:hypothetical protein